MPEESATKLLGQQVGPLPMGGWVAAVIGGLGVAYYIHRKAPAAAPVAAPAAPSAPGATGGANAFGGVLPLPNGAVPAGGLPATPTTTAYQSNSDWVTGATRQLIAQGYDPLLVSRTLGDYVEGKSLDYQESQTLELALRVVGPPPSPPPAQPPAPPAPTQSPPKPAAKMIAAPKYPAGIVNGFNPADPDPTAQYFCPLDYGDAYVLRKDNGYVACMTMAQAQQIDGLLAAGKHFPLP